MSARVLILEDDVDLATTYVQIVEISTSAKVVLAHSIEELKSKAQEALTCDLALLDVSLGQEDTAGIDASLWLKEIGFRGKICFITGHGRRDPIVAKAVSVEGTELLTKPVDINILIKLVNATEALHERTQTQQ